MAALILAAAALGAPASGEAHMYGMYDCARPDRPCPEAGAIGRSCGAGNGSCHGGLLPENTTTQVSIDGLPSAAGYVPGQPYDLTITVLGVSIPLPITGCPFGPLAFPDALNNLAGFNLQATAGLLSLVDSSDGSAQVLNETECQSLRRITHCGLPSLPACPECDDTVIVSSQATHTLEGNKQFSWTLRWSAPDPGVGEVKFYVAGNVVNGNCRQDLGDLWSVSPGFAVLQAGQ